MRVLITGGADFVGSAVARLFKEAHPSWPVVAFDNLRRRGLENFTGDAVAIYMADASDRPEDLIRFFRLMESEGVDCVFGSRFIKGGRTIDYPLPKLVINRCANTFIQALFGLRYNDVTNAFKLYRRRVVDGLRPFLSHHFNLTVELPLKAIVRGYSHAVVPNEWINRKTGISKLKIQEMGSRYLFIVLYCFIEKWLSRGDYCPAQAPAATQDFTSTEESANAEAEWRAANPRTTP